MCNGGMRFFPGLWVGFALDEDSGDMTVELHLKNEEGESHIITGAVVWDEEGE